MSFAILTLFAMLPAFAAHFVECGHWLANAVVKGLLLALTCIMFYCMGKSNIP